MVSVHDVDKEYKFR